MKRIKKWLCYASAIALFNAFVPTTPVLANGTNSAFLISPIFPKNQIPGKSGYFNLNVKSGQKETVYIQIVNNTQTQMDYDVKVANAFTTKNGGIEYVPNKGTSETSLLDSKYLMVNYVKVPNTIVIPPHSITKVPVRITTPNGNEGSFLGAVLFKNRNQNITPKGNQAFQFIQEVYLGIGVQLNLSKPNKDYRIVFGTPEIHFNPSGTQITLETKNMKPEIIKGLTGEYKVYDTKGTLLFHDDIKQFDMAPMSKVNYAINWDNKTISDKDYRLELNLTDGEKVFRYMNLVKVKKKELQTFENLNRNKQNHPQVVSDNSISTYVLYSVIVALLGFIGFLLIKGRKKDRGAKDEE